MRIEAGDTAGIAVSRDEPGAMPCSPSDDWTRRARQEESLQLRQRDRRSADDRARRAQPRHPHARARATTRRRASSSPRALRVQRRPGRQVGARLHARGHRRRSRCSWASPESRSDSPAPGATLREEIGRPAGPAAQEELDAQLVAGARSPRRARQRGLGRGVERSGSTRRSAEALAFCERAGSLTVVFPGRSRPSVGAAVTGRGLRGVRLARPPVRPCCRCRARSRAGRRAVGAARDLHGHEPRLTQARARCDRRSSTRTPRQAPTRSTFNLDGDIDLAGFLPAITDPVTIDGTQPRRRRQRRRDRRQRGGNGRRGARARSRLGRIDDHEPRGTQLQRRNRRPDPIERQHRPGCPDHGRRDGIDVDSGSDDNVIGGSFSADEGNVIYDYTAGGIAIDASSGTNGAGQHRRARRRRRPGRRRLRHRRQRLDRRGRRGRRRPG